jgi:amino acid permease
LINVLIGLAAFVGGALVSWVNFLLLRMLIQNKGNTGIGLVSPIRTILSIAYLVILYWIGKHSELNLTALLIGGALGLTVMLTFFTLRLTKDDNGKGKG